jgi:mRNA interferase MazF
MTSKISVSEYKVFVEDKDLDSGNLSLKSAVRVDKPFSILQSKVLKIKRKVN